MSGPAELAVATGVLVDAALKSTVVVGLGWGAAGLARRGSAAHRHAIWAATFAALPLLPVAATLRGPEVALDLPWLLPLWALGSLFFVAPLLRGLWALRTLRRSARPHPGVPGVLHTDQLSSPVTWGLFRPVIVLPEAAARWPEAYRAAALAHERAHVRRHDWAVHIATWAICTLFWFHPGVWWARRALAREAEHAADDLVLADGVRPSTYAELLLSHTPRAAVRTALGVAQSPVAGRVRAVLDLRPRSATRWPAALLALAAFSLLVPSLGEAALWSVPEEALACDTAPQGLLP